MTIFGEAEFILSARNEAEKEIADVQNAILELSDTVGEALKTIDKLSEVKGPDFEKSREMAGELAASINEVQEALDDLREKGGGTLPGIDKADKSLQALLKRVEGIENSVRKTFDPDLLLQFEEAVEKVGVVGVGAMKGIAAAVEDLQGTTTGIDADLPEAFDLKGFQEELDATAGSAARMLDLFRAGLPIEFAGTAEEQMDKVTKAILLVDKEIANLDAANKGRDLLPETAQKREDLSGLKTQLQELQSQQRASTGIAPSVNADTKALQSYGTAQDRAIKLQRAGIPVVDSADQAIQNYGQTIAGATKAMDKDIKAQEQENRVRAAGVPIIDSATKKIQGYGVLVGKAALEQEKLARAGGKPVFGDEIPTAIKELEELAKEITKLQSLLKKGIGGPEAPALIEEKKAEFTRRATGLGSNIDFDKFTASVQKPVKEISLFDRAIGKLNDKLGEMGLSVSGVAVLLGAGFAGGLAGIIKIFVDLGTKVAEFIGGLIETKRQAQLTFRASTTEVTSFADSASRDLGRTQDELLQTVNAFGELGKGLNVPQENLADFSLGLTQATALIERGLPGFKGLASVQQVIASATQGSDDAFRKLGITLERQRELSLETFGKLPDSLTRAEQGVLGYRAAVDAARGATAEFGRTSASTWGKIKVQALEVAEIIGDMFTRTQQERFNDIFDLINELGTGGGITTGQHTVLQGIAGDLETLSDKQLELLRIQAELQETVTPGERNKKEQILAALDAEIAKRKELKDELKRLEDAYLSNINVQKQNEELFRSNTSAQRGAIDAIRAVAIAEEDGARAIKESLIARQRAYEDAAKRERDVRIENQRQLEDANLRLKDAEAQLQAAREDRDKKLRDHVIEHDRKIEDLNRNHRRKLEDFARREAEIRDKAAFDIVGSFRAIEDAQRTNNIAAERAARQQFQQAQKGSDLKEFEIEKARELEDFLRESDRERQDNARKLNDIEIESNRALADAERQRQEALIQRARAYEDAVNRLHDLEMENSRALFDAQKQVDDAAREAQRSIEAANRSLERMAHDLGIVVDRLREMVGVLNAIPDQGLLNPLTGLPIFLPGNAAGGHLRFGQVGIAGERGRELVVGGSSGSTILPNDLTERILAMLEGRSAGSGNVINVFEAGRDEDELWWAIASRMSEASIR